MLDDVRIAVRKYLASPLERKRFGQISILLGQIMTSRKRGHQQSLCVFSASHMLPKFVALERLHTPDADFPAFATLRHALRRLQPMKVVAVHFPKAGTHTFRERNAIRKVNRRHPRSHWQR